MISRNKTYDPVRLIYIKDYMLRYWHHIQADPDRQNVRAYEAVEKEYYDTFGSNKYSSYESFRVIKSRYLNNLKSKN